MIMVSSADLKKEMDRLVQRDIDLENMQNALWTKEMTESPIVAEPESSEMSGEKYEECIDGLKSSVSGFAKNVMEQRNKMYERIAAERAAIGTLYGDLEIAHAAAQKWEEDKAKAEAEAKAKAEAESKAKASRGVGRKF